MVALYEKFCLFQDSETTLDSLHTNSDFEETETTSTSTDWSSSFSTIDSTTFTPINDDINEWHSWCKKSVAKAWVGVRATVISIHNRPIEFQILIENSVNPFNLVYKRIWFFFELTIDVVNGIDRRNAYVKWLVYITLSSELILMALINII